MLPEWRDVDPYISSGCLFLSLIFLSVSGIPIFGYFVQIGAIFSIILFSFRRMNLLLAIGSVGSIVIASLLLGFSPILLAVWGGVVVPGIVLGKLMAAGSPPSKAFIKAMLFSVALSSVLFWIEKDLIFEGIDNLQKTTALLFSDIGAQEGTRSFLMEDVTKVFDVLKRLMPSLMALSGVMQLFLGWMIFILLLRGLSEFSPALGNFVYWKMPYYYVYITGVFILLRLAGTGQIQMLADNVILFLGFFYAVFGLSVFEYYLKKIRLSLFLRILFYVGFVFLQLPGLMLAALVGLFDSYFDFRRVRARIIG